MDDHHLSNIKNLRKKKKTLGLTGVNQSFTCWTEIEIKKENAKIESILRFSIAII
jgi:hypothetical protein